MYRKVFYLLMISAVLFSGCSSNNFILSRLYFGRNLPDNSVITQQEFNSFTDSCIAPLFPDGFTLYQTNGQWKNKDGVIIKEPGVVMEIVHQPDKDVEMKLNRIIDLYKKKFRQESVLYIKMKAEMKCESQNKSRLRN